MEPIIITVAGSGGKWTAKDSPYVPMTPEEIVEDAVESFNAGATMFHIHARTEDGTPTFEPAYFEKIMNPMRKRCPGVVIQMSTGRMEGQVAEKLEPLMKLKPDLASFNLKGSDEETHLMAEIMSKYGVKPAVECFTLDMVEKANELVEKGLLAAPIFAESVFELEDSDESFISKAEHLLLLGKNFPKNTVWSQTRGGSDQVALQAMTLALGGHLRTGLEDNLFTTPGVHAKSSAELIKKTVELVLSMGKRPATVQETRKILGLV